MIKWYKIFCIVIILNISNSILAQDYFNKIYSNPWKIEFGSEIHLLDNGNLLQLGSRSEVDDSLRLGLREIDIRMFNPSDGNLIWQDVVKNDSISLYINSTHEFAVFDSTLYIVDIAQQLNGNEILFSNPYFLKYNLPQQQLIEIKYYSFEKQVNIKSLVFHQGYFYAVGYIRLYDEYADLDCLMLKIDKAGSLIWYKTFDFGKGEQIFEIESFKDELLITGAEINDFTESFIARLDTSGNILKKIQSIPLGKSGTIEIEIYNDNIYFLTTAGNQIVKYFTQYLAQFDGDLNLKWDTLIPNTSRYDINCRRMEILNDEIIIASNINKGGEYTNKQVWSHVASWSLEGQFNWEHIYQYDSSFTHHLDDVEAMSNGDLIFMGTVFDVDRNENFWGDQYLWLFRTDSQGCGTVQETCYYTLDEYFGLDTMVSIVETQLPDVDLVKVLGNPFNEQLEVQSNSNQLLEISIHNIQGKTVYEGVLNGGLSLNTANWQSGVYVMQIMNEDKLVGLEKLVRE